MSVETFLILLTAFSVITSLMTEASKKAFQNAAYNALVLANSLIVSIGGSIVYYVITDTVITAKIVAYSVILVVATWLCAMIGYDKVMQSMVQIGVLKR